MNKEQLKEALIYLGVPIYKNDQICKKDIVKIKNESTGLNVFDIKKVEVIKKPEYFICNLHVLVENEDDSVEKIDEIFQENKQMVEKNILNFLHRNHLACVTAVEVKLKSRNVDNIWLDIYVHFDFEPAIEDLAMEAFIHQLFGQKS